MKKRFSAILVLALIFVCAGFIGCAGPGGGPEPSAAPAVTAAPKASAAPAPAAAAAPAPAEPEAAMIGFSVTTTTDSFLAAIIQGTTDNYAKLGVTVVAAGCEGDANTQISQLENFVTMGVRQIIVLPRAADSLEAVLTDAHAAGVQILMLNDDPSYYVDVKKLVDHAKIGTCTAEMAIAWADRRYPGAETGALHVAMLSNTQIPQLKARCEAAEETIQSDPRFQITFRKDGLNNTDDSVTATQEALTVDKDVKVFLCWTESLGIGVNNIISGLPNVDLSAYGAFSASLSEAAKQLIDASQTEASCFRGTVTYGAADPTTDVFNDSLKLFKGEFTLPATVYDPIQSYNFVGYTAQN